MKKILYMVREMIYLVRQERLYALALLLLLLAVVAVLVYQVTPLTVVTFIYAGI
ncbi:MAG: hypothetical protein ABIO70_19225 [Pseudomonadota bacterium]